MIIKICWIVIYILTWSIHVIGWIPVALVVKRLSRNTLVRIVIIVLSFITMTYAFSGCPITYLTQRIEVHLGWSEEVAYGLEDSLAYKYIIGPAKNLWENLTDQ
jgi:hypothetical protein